MITKLLSALYGATLQLEFLHVVRDLIGNSNFKCEYNDELNLCPRNSRQKRRKVLLLFILSEVKQVGWMGKINDDFSPISNNLLFWCEESVFRPVCISVKKEKPKNFFRLSTAI